MTGKTHQSIGIAAGFGYFLVTAPSQYNPSTLGAVVVASYIGALLPDIDRPTARIWNTLPYGGTAGKVVHNFFEHRNLTHSILGMVIFGMLAKLLLGYFPDYWGIDVGVVLLVFLISFGSHLLADMFTIEGIPVFFPYHRFMGIPPKPLEGIRIQTGEWFENLVIFPVVNIGFIIFLILDRAKLHQILFK